MKSKKNLKIHSGKAFKLMEDNSVGHHTVPSYTQMLQQMLQA